MDGVSYQVTIDILRLNVNCSFHDRPVFTGFKRLYQKGPDNGCFYHECFLRAMPELTAMITRVPPKQGKCSPFPDGEPSELPVTRMGSRGFLTNPFLQILRTYPKGTQCRLRQNKARGVPPLIQSSRDQRRR